MYKIANALGVDESHVATVDWGDSGAFWLHADAIAAVEQLRGDAAKAGFELAIASGYRSFDRQLAIWQTKAAGKRPVLDDNELAIDIARLTPTELVRAILRWSALPGGSRHHWGSDFDVYPRNLLAEGQNLLLTQQECEQVFKPFYQWLASYLQAHRQFVRPFSTKAERPVLKFGEHVVTCAIASEPWHISFQPVAQQFEQLLSAEALASLLQSRQVPLHAAIMADWPAIYNDYIVAYFAG